MGWGRLAGNGDFENPMTWLSDTFSVRETVIQDWVASYQREISLAVKR